MTYSVCSSALLCVLITTSTAFATAMTETPIYACLAKCVSVNPQTQRVTPLDTALSESRRDIQEAFALMAMDCRQQSEQAGLGSSTLLVSEIEVYSSSARSYEGANTTLSENLNEPRRRSFVLKYQSHSSKSAESHEHFYKGTTVGFEACQVLQRNTSVKPHYIGPGQPLG